MGSGKYPDTGGTGSVTGTDWFSRMAAFLFGKVPQLTESVPVRLGTSPNAPAGTNWADANVEGGAVKTAAQWGTLSAVTVYQSLATGKIGFAFRARLSALGAGNAGYLGLVTLAGNGKVTLEADVTADATHYVMRYYNGATPTTQPTTALADHLFHDFAFVLDGTSYRVFLDPLVGGANASTPIGTITGFTGLLDAPAAPGWHYGGSSDTAVVNGIYAYVAV